LHAVDDLTTTTGIVALTGAAIALIALGLAVATLVQVRRIRVSQRVLLDDPDAKDVVGHVARLSRSFEALHDHLDELAQRLEARMEKAEARLDGAIAHRGVVHYDAYNDISGRNSASIALLDGKGSGVILSSIHYRDQSRIYAKQVLEGKADGQLSPEEEEAVSIALSLPGGAPGDR
jgi:hypothetical protein